MKIFKYILLLLLLVFIASSVFVATLNPDYNVVRTRTIKSSKSEVFNYVNDYKNWSEFGTWKQDDPNMKFTYPKNTIGKGGYYSWKGQDGDGSMTTIFVKQDDSIHQKMFYNGAASNVYWSFKNTKNGTKITWRNVGKMDFVTKIFTTLRGGIDNITGNMYERSLVNIEQNLKKQLKQHSVITDGFIETTMGMYVQKTINSKNENVDRNIRIMIPNLLKYLKENKIVTSGKPFVKYNYSNDLKETTCLSVCLPLKDSIKTILDNGYTFDNMLPFQAIKATLKGDLIYKKEATTRALQSITESNLMQKTEKPIIEIYKISNIDDENSNNWITEIYIPVKKKEFLKKYIKPVSVVNSSNNNTNQSATATVADPIIEKIIIKKDFPQ